MKFFVILTLLLISARIAVVFFDVPAAASTALTYACVVVGVIALVFVGVRIYKDLRGK